MMVCLLIADNMILVHKTFNIYLSKNVGLQQTQTGDEDQVSRLHRLNMYSSRWRVKRCRRNTMKFFIVLRADGKLYHSSQDLTTHIWRNVVIHTTITRAVGEATYREVAQCWQRHGARPRLPWLRTATSCPSLYRHLLHVYARPASVQAPLSPFYYSSISNCVR